LLISEFVEWFRALSMEARSEPTNPQPAPPFQPGCHDDNETDVLEAHVI